MYAKIVNFFSTKSVSQKIVNNTLSESQLFLYFYCIMAFDALNFVQGCLSMAGEKLTISNLIFIWGYFAFTALGLIALFILNGGFKGKNFISKFFAFSFTVGFKYEIVEEILNRLSEIPMLKIPHYALISCLTLNLLMVVNIGYRIYETRGFKNYGSLRVITSLT